MAIRVLIAGVATRAFAESAARAGYEVLAVDGFGDLDLEACAATVVRARDRAGRFSRRRALRAARELSADAVSYVASFENYPSAIAPLARERMLWGNGARALARVRDPVRLASVAARHGWAVPAVRTTLPARRGPIRWLVKPRASGGGHGILEWQGSRSRARHHYFQERIAGIPGSLVFAACPSGVVAIGLSRMLVGDRAFGAAAFRYCGSILSPSGDPQFAAEPALAQRLVDFAGTVAQEFGLVGVNGVDFIARRGTPYPVEVNPRYTASMELVERCYGLSVFQTHAQTCAGELPAFDLARARSGQQQAIGKAIVYARHDTQLGDTRAWLGDPSVRDVPRPGERIARGQPICTVFAAAATAARCRRALAARAAQVYAAIQ